MAGRLVESAPNLSGGTEDAFCQEGGIDQWLRMAVVEHQMVGELWIDTVLQCFHNQIDIAGPELTLFRLIRTKFEPRGNAADGAACGFKNQLNIEIKKVIVPPFSLSMVGAGALVRKTTWYIVR